MNVFRVWIDLGRLRDALSQENRETTTEEDTTRWLAESGFFRTADAWLVREADLGQLRPEEVVRAEVFEFRGDEQGAASAKPAHDGVPESVLTFWQQQAPSGWFHA